jgi:putative transcriptional regulator
VGATRTALNVAIFLASLGWGASAVHAVAGSHAPTAQLLPGVVKELATGKLLIAARDLPDGNFSETVILLADYSSEGAMGLIINRETEVPLARAFPQLKQVSARARIFAGGPVATTRMIGLLRTTAPAADVRHIVRDVYLVATREPLEGLIASGADPNRFRVYFGYAGWAPGQLERETVEGSWHVLQGESALIFDPDPSSVWRRQIRRTDGLMAARQPNAPTGHL